MSEGTGQPWAAPTGPPADRPDPAPTGGTWIPPFSSLRELAEWWWHPVIEARSWVALGYLFVGALWGPLMFVALVAAFGVVFGLAFAVVGLFLVSPLFGLVDAIARVERRRAEWVGAPIPPRVPAPSSAGFWDELRTRLSDPTRWRQVAYLASFSVAGPVFFAVGTVLWGLVARLAGGPGGAAASVAGLLLAVPLAGAAPRVTVAVAGVARSYVAWFLGPDANTELAERVEALSTQRQQILEAVDGERRRIERNLHDGVQPQLVALGIDIARARARIDDDPEEARHLLDDAREKVRGSIGELRLIGRGLHPAVLDDRGLDAALSSVVADSPIPVSMWVSVEGPLPDEVATTAYYVVSEAVANILKHSRARVGSVRVDAVAGPPPALHIAIHDDGRGGADASRGTGLVGMRARVEGMDGTFRLESPPGGPTTIVAVIPLSAEVRR